MKKRIVLLVAFTAVLFSCSDKVLVQASEPAVVSPPEPPVPVIADVPSAPTPESISQGKELYDAKCGNCHKLFTPSDFSAEHWVPILKRMQKQAKLDDLQMKLVDDYVFSSLGR